MAGRDVAKPGMLLYVLPQGVQRRGGPRANHRPAGFAPR